MNCRCPEKPSIFSWHPIELHSFIALCPEHYHFGMKVVPALNVVILVYYGIVKQEYIMLLLQF